MKVKAGVMFLLLFYIFIGMGCSRERKEDVNIEAENSEFDNKADNEAEINETEDKKTLSDALAAAGNTEPSGQPVPSQELAQAAGPTLSPEQMPQPDTDYVSEEMYQNAVLADGNTARLAAAMRKAENGEEITVGVIGGSITQGSLASNSDNSYATRFCKWWEAAFPETKVNFINAGLGGTTSYLGVHRADTELLAYKPDVVIVEFSVNDSNTFFYKETYEDLVRKILKADNMPAVLLLFTTMEDGTSAQTNDLLIGFKYDLPRISYREMVLKEIGKGSFSWDDISPDNIHPNDKGHAMIGEVLWRYLNHIYAKLDNITEQPEPLTVKPYFNEAYVDAVILDSSGIEPVRYGSFKKASVNDRFKNDWRTEAGSDAILFETKAQNIGIMFLKTIDGRSGQFDVYIDGDFSQTLNADFKGGWGNYQETVEVYRSKEKQLHQIEIRKNPNSTGDIFSILGLLIS